MVSSFCIFLYWEHSVTRRIEGGVGMGWGRTERTAKEKCGGEEKSETENGFKKGSVATRGGQLQSREKNVVATDRRKRKANPSGGFQMPPCLPPPSPPPPPPPLHSPLPNPLSALNQKLNELLQCRLCFLPNKKGSTDVKLSARKVKQHFFLFSLLMLVLFTLSAFLTFSCLLLLLTLTPFPPRFLYSASRLFGQWPTTTFSVAQ